MQRNCSLYLRADPNPPNTEELKKQLQGNLEEKAAALKILIRCIINDESYPRLIMHIISNIIPVVHQSSTLRKLMLLYWEVVEKTKSETDSALKDEMLLACNSLKKDLLCANEFLRARTLRLVSRCMHQGIIDPLANDIVQNLSHKSSYVRRNAIVCLYQVFLHFGVDVIGDIDEEVQKLLLTQTDLSTKRNAFLLLHQSNEQKAMGYIHNQMVNQNLEEMGDILQIAILEIFRRKCKEDPNQKARLLKIILDFSKKANESVMLECALSLIAISTSPSSLKNALNSFASILSSTTQLNVKKVILDKLQVISRNSKYLEDIVGDLIQVLETPSFEIKEKVLQIIRCGLTLKNAQRVLQCMELQFQKCQDRDYQLQLIWTIQHIALTFSETHQLLLKTITQKVFPCQKLETSSCHIVKDVLIHLIESSDEPNIILQRLIDAFSDIRLAQLFKGVLYIFGTYLSKPQLICKALDKIKINIGSLPITRPNARQPKEPVPEVGQKKKIIKTIVLPDGTYGTKVIDEQELHKELKKQQQLALRRLIVEDSILGGVLVRNISKMFYILRTDTTMYNRYGCSILMIFCSLLRYYQQNIHEVDQASIDQITFLIKIITNPQQFDKLANFLQIGLKNQKREIHERQASDVIQKNPDDNVLFRQLKGKNNPSQLDFQDEQLNQNSFGTTNESTELISRLKTLVQLTGYFDPIYGETFVTIKNYDVFFDILLINNRQVNLLNVQVQFFSNTQIIVIQKAASCNLKPGQSVNVRCHIKFIKSQLGSIYGSINYDNQAGIEQAYLTTEQIKVDFLQFIQPAKIKLSDFRRLWKELPNEASTKKETANTDVVDILLQHEKYLHCCIIDPQEHYDERFINVHLYGKSKLGDDFLLTLVMVRDEKVQISYSIKAKEESMAKLLASIICKQFTIQEPVQE